MTKIEFDQIKHKKVADLTLLELATICADRNIACGSCPILEICSWFKPASGNIKKTFLDKEVNLSD